MVVADSIASPTFTDDSVTNGASYRYVVSALSDASESADSADVTAVLEAKSLPEGWKSTDIGGVGRPGRASHNRSARSFTVSGSGNDLWGPADGLHFVYRRWSGDGSLVVHVASFEETHEWARCGAMVRQSLEPGSAMAMIAMTPGRGCNFLFRRESDGPCEMVGGAQQAWLKIVRSGSTIAGWTSQDGRRWKSQGKVEIPMSGPIYLGLGVCSHNQGRLNTVVFDHVEAKAENKIVSQRRAETARDSLPTNGPTVSPRRIAAVDRSYMDLTVSPCKDFYAYANGTFEKVPIPGEYSAYGVNQEIDERNFAILKTVLESSARSGGPKGSVVQRVGDFYASGMDEAAIDGAGLQPLAPWLKRIQDIADRKDVVAVLAHLQALGLNVGFGLDVQIDDKDTTAMIAGFNQGGLGLPERDYYFRNGKNGEEIRAAYVAHIARILELAGDAPEAAKGAARSIMAFETKLAKASRTLVELRDPEKNYNKFRRVALDKLAPGLDWNGYFATIAFPRNEAKVLVRQPEFLTAFDKLLKSEPPAVWRDYLRWHLLSECANYLGKPFVEERFAFVGKKLSGATELRPRWKRVLAAEDVAIGEDLGQLYVARAFTPAAKVRARTMVELHKEALRGRILAATWMSQATKAQAYKKLDTMRSKIGYPDRWRDYGRLDIARRSYVLNVLAANAFEFRRQLDKLGKPVDRDEWHMTPQTNNAYYDPTLNEVCFPAGILQPPFFDEKADEASNYGAIGSTIGHELTHGFDDEGRQYDWQGNLKNWWTDDDAKAFEARAQRVARQYDAYEVLPGLHINGQQTLGENIADIGGLRVSYAAFKLATRDKKPEPLDGFTPDQRFFIAFGQSWRTNERPELVRLHVASDVHSPVRWRVLGSVANFPEFLQAFGCPTPAENRPSIW